MEVITKKRKKDRIIGISDISFEEETPVCHIEEDCYSLYADSNEVEWTSNRPSQILKPNQSIIEPGKFIKLPNNIARELEWKVGDIIWFRIYDKDMSVVEIGKVATSIKDFEKSLKALGKEE